MTRLTLPFTDAELYLAPRWGAGGVLVALVSAALVLWLYRYELRLVSRRAALGLLVLRVLAVLVLLGIVFVQPTIARSSAETQAQRILVFVDRTASMDVSDPQRPAMEKIKLARALHLARDIVSDLQLDEWIQQYQGPDVPPWVAPSGSDVTTTKNLEDASAPLSSRTWIVATAFVSAVRAPMPSMALYA